MSYKDHLNEEADKVREQKRQQNMKKKYLEELVKSQTKKHILDTLEEESKQWISNTESIDQLTNTIIPNVHYKQSDYYIKMLEVD